MKWAAAILVFGALTTVTCTEVSDVDDGQPYLHMMARPSVFNAGERRAIFCQGRNLPSTINWFTPTGDMVSERSATNNRVYVERKADRNGILVPLIIHEVKVEDAGRWTCKAGEHNETIDIIVGIKVKIPNRHTTMEGDEGKTVKMSCEANGYPLPVIQWYKDGKLINEKSSSSKYSMKRKGDKYYLEVKDLTYEDIGEYLCKVMQKALSYYTDKTILLSVKHAPVLGTFQTVEVFAAMNATKNITCSAIANPTPTYQWYRRRNNYDTEIPEEDTIVTAEDGTSSTLMLRLNTNENLGEYKCKVSNNKGSETVIFDVSAGRRPDPPDQVYLVGSNTTYLNFNVTCSTCLISQNISLPTDPNNLTLTGYDIELTPVNEGFPPDWEAAYRFEMAIEQPEVTEFAVGELPNTTTFHGRVRSRNLAGESDWFDIDPNPSTSKAIRYAATAFLILVALILARY
ncbi:hypothetical protein ACJJTC_006757 [Scirpophaga incertulas]